MDFDFGSTATNLRSWLGAIGFLGSFHVGVLRAPRNEAQCFVSPIRVSPTARPPRHEEANALRTFILDSDFFGARSDCLMTLEGCSSADSPRWAFELAGLARLGVHAPVLLVLTGLDESGLRPLFRTVESLEDLGGSRVGTQGHAELLRDFRASHLDGSPFRLGRELVEHARAQLLQHARATLNLTPQEAQALSTPYADAVGRSSMTLLTGWVARGDGELSWLFPPECSDRGASLENLAAIYSGLGDETPPERLAWLWPVVETLEPLTRVPPALADLFLHGACPQVKDLLRASRDSQCPAIAALGTLSKLPAFDEATPERLR